jgi:hypothetical protein
MNIRNLTEVVGEFLGNVYLQHCFIIPPGQMNCFEFKSILSLAGPGLDSSCPRALTTLQST